MNPSGESPFLPPAFAPPSRVETAEFVLVPLTPEHNERDYDAWATSVPELRGIFGPGASWPADVAGLDGNLRDLEKHFAAFGKTEATYTVLSPDESRCLGCVYFRRSRAKRFDCRVDYWVRASDRERLEPILGEFIRRWLREAWPFRAIAFPGRELPWSEWERAAAE